MHEQLTPTHKTPPNLDMLRAELNRLSQSQFSTNTKLHYGYDWQVFKQWCDRAERTALPAAPETLALFVTDLILKGQHINSVSRRVYGVAFTHRNHGMESPLTQDVKDLLRAGRRLNTVPPRQMQPLDVEQIRTIATRLKNEGTPIATRDRAIFLVGFLSALRRSTLRALDVCDIEFRRQGAVIHVRREKQDQEGQGRYIGIPFGSKEVTCPVRALKEWLMQRGGKPGALFTSNTDLSQMRMGIQSLYAMVKRRIDKAGINPRTYGPHSLRAGFVTATGETGANHLQIAAQTGHRSLTALQRYFRRSNVFQGNPCALLKL